MTASYKPLNDKQIETLKNAGCRSTDWTKVLVSDDFDPAKVYNSCFTGNVKIAGNTGTVKTASGLEKPAGIYNASIVNTAIGRNTRIANVGVHIANYDIGDNVSIENVGTIQTNPAAAFGNGTEVSVLNEAGGREVILFNELNVQFAYMMCVHRYRPDVIVALEKIAKDYTESIRSDRGTIAERAKICSTTEIIDINVGPAATINGAAALKNGTILSSADAPTTIGPAVTAKDFIVAESSSVTDAVVLDRVFVGQGCKIGKQYSAENSLFFANCEGFHGEACSVFAGPYTVSHHKSTLMIAAMFSFYNAGSGTNQSNHMYKLGPCHEGKILRGSKTGSFSYMMWPCVVGPFSVVLGKHTSTFDTSDYPFSHLDARSDGKCAMVPGLHLTTVGTVRDGAKWPNRDRRKGSVKRDFITFDVLSPYIVGKMIKASDSLKELSDTTDKSIGEVSVGGAIVRRLILRTGVKYYKNGIELYLLEKVIDKIEQALLNGVKDPAKIFAGDLIAVYCDEWVDLGGLLMPQSRLTDLHSTIAAGNIKTIDQFNTRLAAIEKSYRDDEWLWIKAACKKIFGTDLDTAAKEDLIEAVQTLAKNKTKFLNLVIADAEKEFAEFSRTGFGADGAPEDQQKDFDNVRGTCRENSFVKDMTANVEDLKSRVDSLLTKLADL